MKSSTKTSISAMVEVRSDVGKSVKCGGSIFVSNGCAGRGVLRRDAIVSRAVSDAAQKNAGDLHQPICRQLGTTIWRLSMVVFFVVLS